MKNPYMPARKRPIAGLPELFMKNDTVIGTMGNTQGVSKAAKPHRIASMINAHSEPPPAASFCAGSAGIVRGFRNGGLVRSPGWGRILRRGGRCRRCAGLCRQVDRHFRILGRHAARVVADHPLQLGRDGGLFGRELHPLGEERLAGKGADLHLEGLVVVALGSGELLYAALERSPGTRGEGDRRGIGPAFIGPHVIHMVRRGDRGFEYDPVHVAVEVLHGAFPAYVLRRDSRHGKQGRYGQ